MSQKAFFSQNQNPMYHNLGGIRTRILKTTKTSRIRDRKNSRKNFQTVGNFTHFVDGKIKKQVVITRAVRQ